MSVTVVLVRPSVAGNVGAIARVMSNFGVSDLVLICPECDYLSKESLDRAKHAKDILKKAKVFSSLSSLKSYFKIPTTCRLGSDYNLHRTPILPSSLAKVLPDNKDVALIFGPEGPGLSNEEILCADLTLTIPTSKEYSSMNLSHAVCVVLYEIFAHKSEDHVASHYAPMSENEHKQIIRMADGIIEDLFPRMPARAQTQKKLWRNIVGRSFITKREAFALMGFLRQTLRRLRKSK